MKKYPDFYKRSFSLGEIAVHIDEARSLGELCRPKARLVNAHHYRKSLKIGGRCLQGYHAQCYKADCTCHCHRRGA